MAVSTQQIPLVDLAAQYATIKDEVRAAWDEILGSMRLLLGPHSEAFDREFAALCGTRHAIGVSSGTDAVHLPLRALGVGPDDEVITPSFTFFAAIEAVRYTGARPVFVDVDEATALMNVEAALGQVTSRTKALLPVHLYGRTVPLARLRTAGVPVVEDACQAHGAALDVGGRAGSCGAAGAFSFYFSKNLGAYGEGGSMTTNDDALAERLRLLRNHGQVTRYESVLVGYNARIDELQAAVLRIKLRRLLEWNARRRELARSYDRLLADVPVSRPPLPKGEEHVFHLYVIRVPDRRDALRSFLTERGIGTGVHYPIPCHLQKGAADLGWRRGSLPITERIADEVLSLPMYPELSDDQLERVVGAVRDFFRR
jgi:dTDP-4-amino-4,6-dideoxygalactose transaminase